MRVDGRGAVFRPAQTCAGQPAGAACWQEISQQPGCYVWNSNLQPDETVTWTGECIGGFAQGMGTLTWVSDDNGATNSGRLQDGKHTGHWVLRLENGVRLRRPVCRRSDERPLGPPLRERARRGRPVCVRVRPGGSTGRRRGRQVVPSGGRPGRRRKGRQALASCTRRVVGCDGIAWKLSGVVSSCSGAGKHRCAEQTRPPAVTRASQRLQGRG